MADWKVRGATQSCFACNKSFPPEADFHSALYFVPPEVERRDFCPTCWANLTPAEALAYWTLRPSDAGGAGTDIGPLDMNAVKRLLKGDPKTGQAPRGLAGLLALMLARRRLVKLESVAGETLYVRFRDEDEVVEIPSPRLDSSALEKAQEALWDIIDQMAAPPA